VSDATSETLAACPALSAAFELLGKRWTALVLDVVANRPARFCEIQRAIPGLSDRLLTERLRELTAHGLIDREESAEGKMVYDLTPLGRRLVPAFNEIRSWAGQLSSATA
jgi:DNA-binding HxlR family transcriptional regulator